MVLPILKQIRIKLASGHVWNLTILPALHSPYYKNLSKLLQTFNYFISYCCFSTSGSPTYSNYKWLHKLSLIIVPWRPSGCIDSSSCCSNDWFLFCTNIRRCTYCSLFDNNIRNEIFIGQFHAN